MNARELTPAEAARVYAAMHREYAAMYRKWADEVPGSTRRAHWLAEAIRHDRIAAAEDAVANGERYALA